MNNSVTNPGLRFYATRMKFAGTAFGRPPQLAKTTCGFFYGVADWQLAAPVRGWVEGPVKAKAARGRKNKWRKCMGIEPTGATFIVTPSDFEDRGHHQVCKHFRSILYLGRPRTECVGSDQREDGSRQVRSYSSDLDRIRHILLRFLAVGQAARTASAQAACAMSRSMRRVILARRFVKQIASGEVRCGKPCGAAIVCRRVANRCASCGGAIVSSPTCDVCLLNVARVRP